MQDHPKPPFVLCSSHRNLKPTVRKKKTKEEEKSITTNKKTEILLQDNEKKNQLKLASKEDKSVEYLISLED